MGVEGNLGFLRSDLFLPPFSKTCRVTSAQANILQSWKLKIRKHLPSVLNISENGKFWATRWRLPKAIATCTAWKIDFLQSGREKIHLKSVLKQISCCFQLVKYEEFILDKKLSNIFQDHLSQEKNTCTISTASSEYKWRKGFFAILRKAFLYVQQ